MISATEEVAVREWVKVPNIPGLYRNTVSGRYYGFKKVRGRRKERSLRTTDRKIAERRHREWISNLQRVDRECERMTLRELLERVVAVNQGRSVKTQGTNDSITTVRVGRVQRLRHEHTLHRGVLTQPIQPTATRHDD